MTALFWVMLPIIQEKERDVYKVELESAQMMVLQHKFKKKKFLREFVYKISGQ